METATAKVSSRKDVQALINDKVIELLEKGIVPWRKPWTAGIPRNLINEKPYRNINLLLLSCLGYESNIFIRENQMKEIGATILPGERPHMVAFWNYKDEAGNAQPPTLRYYHVYNVTQCGNISDELLIGIGGQPFDVDACRRIVLGMLHCPQIKHKESTAYYDVLEDYVNMPKQKAFESEREEYSALFHQLIHSTGHHTRLDRMGLVQMAEYGYTEPSQEEILADIGTRYMEAATGIIGNAPWNDTYLQACISKLKVDKNFIFATASLAQKAIDFILSEEVEAEETTVTEEATIA